MSGRLMQALTNWANNNPAQHAEYAAHHLLQLQHHHNTALLAAAAAAAPEHLLALQRQLASGRELHVDMLAYGNISRQEAAELVAQVQQQLNPKGLPPGCWPPAGRVLCLSPLPAAAAAAAGGVTGKHQDGQPCNGAASWAAAAVAASEAAGRTADLQQPALLHGSVEDKGAQPPSTGAVYVTYLPSNPNPSNSNSAIYYTVQLGPDAVELSVLLDLFAQMSSKAAFHELRTRQRLGYSVSLSSTSLHRQLGLLIRVQSPSTQPDALAAAVRAWLVKFREELQQMAHQQLPQHKKVSDVLGLKLCMHTTLCGTQSSTVLYSTASSACCGQEQATGGSSSSQRLQVSWMLLACPC